MAMLSYKDYQNKLKNIDWIKVGLCFIILVLVFFLFKSCEKPVTNTETDKTLIEKLQKDSKKYENIANIYRDSVRILKEKKVVIQKEVDKSVTATKEKLKPVSSLTTKGIALYFQTNYKTPVVITQYGVALSDTLGKRVIEDLIKGKGAEEQLDLTQGLLFNEEQENKIKDNIIVNLDKALAVKDSIDAIQNSIIKDTEKSLKAEKNKKTSWQVATGTAVTIITYLIIKD